MRAARAGDLPDLFGLERTSFPDPWPPTTLAQELAQPTALVLVCERTDGRVVAYAGFRAVGAEAELLRVAVTPGERRRGHARRLLRAGLAQLRRRGVGSCFLEVRLDNLAAQILYESEGFLLVGRRNAYYLDGADALVYRRDLG